MTVASLGKLPELNAVDQDAHSVRATYNELQIDVLLTRNPPFKRVLSDYSTVQRFLDRDIPLASAEGIVLLKPDALPPLYRQSNFARAGLYEHDIASLLHYDRPDLPTQPDVLSTFVSASDFAEITGTVADVQHRNERFPNGAPSGGRYRTTRI